MKLDKLLERLDYTVVQGSDSTEVTTLINDSRKVEEGSVFVCISGAVSDGHKYAKEVVEKGATVLVVQDEVEVPEEFKGAECLITNLGRKEFDGKIILNPYEAFVLYYKHQVTEK